jgi:hypothetical protein
MSADNMSSRRLIQSELAQPEIYPGLATLARGVLKSTDPREAVYYQSAVTGGLTLGARISNEEWQALQEAVVSIQSSNLRSDIPGYSAYLIHEWLTANSLDKVLQLGYLKIFADSSIIGEGERSEQALAIFSHQLELFQKAIRHMFLLRQKSATDTEIGPQLRQRLYLKEVSAFDTALNALRTQQQAETKRLRDHERYFGHLSS